MSNDNNKTFYEIINEKPIKTLLLFSLIWPLYPLGLLFEKTKETFPQQIATFVNVRKIMTFLKGVFKILAYFLSPVFSLLFFFTFLGGWGLLGDISNSGFTILKAYVAVIFTASLMFHILFTLAINCLTCAIIIAFEYNHILTMAFSESIKKELGDYLIWSRLWAGPKSHSLLDTLKKDNNVEKSKWLMVNFLNNIVEESQTTNREITYEMPLWEYSEFISHNITHAKKMSWRVSSKDLFGLFLPQAIMSVIIEMGLRRAKITFHSDSNDISESIDDATGKLYEKVQTKEVEWGKDSEAISRYDKTSKKYQKVRMKTMENFIAPICFCEGIDFLKKAIEVDRIIASEVIGDVEKIYKKTNDEGLNYPHVESFRQTKIDKIRTITLKQNVKSYEQLKTAITKRWNDHKTEFNKFFDDIRKECPENCNKKQNCIESFDDGPIQEIIEVAMEVFVYSCGGKEFLKISGRKCDDIDIGLYDEKISIESEGIPNKRRKVSVKYDESSIITEFHELHSNDGDGSKDDYTQRQRTDDFIKKCKKVLEIG